MAPELPPRLQLLQLTQGEVGVQGGCSGQHPEHLGPSMRARVHPWGPLTSTVSSATVT